MQIHAPGSNAEEKNTLRDSKTAKYQVNYSTVVE